jgi:hypothetical protein
LWMKWCGQGRCGRETVPAAVHTKFASPLSYASTFNNLGEGLVAICTRWWNLHYVSHSLAQSTVTPLVNSYIWLGIAYSKTGKTAASYF